MSTTQTPTQTQSSFPIFRRFFSWRTLRWGIAGLAALGTLAALVIVVENWRGKRAWEQFKREWEAKGEKFELSAFVPPPVPDEQNLMLAPLFKELQYDPPRPDDLRAKARVERVDATVSDSGQKAPSGRKGWLDMPAWQEFYRGNANYPQPTASQTPAADVLLALSKFDPEITELRQAAAARPLARAPLHYDDPYPTAMLFPHLAIWRRLATVLQLRAAAELELSRPAAALEDLQLGYRLSDVLAAEPFLLCHLVRISINERALPVVQKGLATHAWSEEQLRGLQSYYARANLLAEYDHCMRGERAAFIATLEGMPRQQWKDFAEDQSRASSAFAGLAPRCIIHRNELSLCRFFQDNILPAVNAQAQRVSPERADAIEGAIGKMRTTPYNVMAKLLIPALSKAAHRSARVHTLTKLATVACALERYRLANGQYPDKLEALAPRFLESLPPDVITGQPLKYRRADADKFLLYSVGWDSKDDGGVPAAETGKGKPATATGDWVWGEFPK